MQQGENIVGVQFRQAGKLYDFASKDLNVEVGDHVVVETDRGPSLAKVAVIHFSPVASDGKKGDRKLKAVIRKATSHELSKKNRLSEDDVTKFTKETTERLSLKMKILKSEVQFGGNKVIVYFTAPGRVDFRGLVKELAAGLKTRVELTQVGARDETKLLGGIGICGREYCCSTFLREFLPVSIKMAKNQNLALNPSKVSGGCGRLLCCLTYEDDVYTDLRKTLPARGAKLRLLERGDEGTVIRCDVLNQLVLVKTEQGTMLVPLKETERIEVKKEKAPAATAPTDNTMAEAEQWGEDLDMDLLKNDGKEKKAKSSNDKEQQANQKEKSQKPERGSKYKKQHNKQQNKNKKGKSDEGKTTKNSGENK